MVSKKNFPIFDSPINEQLLVYLDNAATTHKPKVVIDAIANFYAKHNANTHRGVHTLGETATTLYEQARERVAQFIGAQPHEVVFTSSATDSINLVAHAWALKNLQPGDEIVVSEMEHHSNMLPWQWVAQQVGAALIYIPANFDGTIELSAIDDIVTERTKLVAVSHVSNAVGTTNDIAKIITRAREVGAKILIDASQSVPHMPVDVTTLDCDFLVFSGHKMLGPLGIGVAYLHERTHTQLQPYRRGGGMVYEATVDGATWLPMPRLLEAGTPPIAQAVGLHAALDYLTTQVDFKNLSIHEANLCARLIDGLEKIPEVSILGPIDELKDRGHLVSFLVDGVHPHDVAAFLSSRGICVRAGHHCAQPLAKKLGVVSSVRASFYVYNTVQDVDTLVGSLQELINSLR